MTNMFRLLTAILRENSYHKRITMQVNCIPLSKGQYIYITSSVQGTLAHKQCALNVP